MSSTKRGKDRHESDYYVTPIKAIIDFLKEFSKKEPNVFSDGIILDPCAGGDGTNPMSYPFALRRFGVSKDRIETLDIRSDSPAKYHEDFLCWTHPWQYDIIISNPPFILAMEFIKKSLDIVSDGGFVVMLLRLNFFGSKKRKPFWEEHMPKYAFVHNARMSFTSDGKTDSIEYMHAVWQKGNKADCKLFVI